jgi:hypothetical protein
MGMCFFSNDREYFVVNGLLYKKYKFGTDDPLSDEKNVTKFISTRSIDSSLQKNEDERQNSSVEF